MNQVFLEWLTSRMAHWYLTLKFLAMKNSTFQPSSFWSSWSVAKKQTSVILYDKYGI